MSRDQEMKNAFAFLDEYDTDGISQQDAWEMYREISIAELHAFCQILSSEIADVKLSVENIADLLADWHDGKGAASNWDKAYLAEITKLMQVNYADRTKTLHDLATRAGAISHILLLKCKNPGMPLEKMSTDSSVQKREGKAHDAVMKIAKELSTNPPDGLQEMGWTEFKIWAGNVLGKKDRKKAIAVSTVGAYLEKTDCVPRGGFKQGKKGLGLPDSITKIILYGALEKDS